MLVALAMLIKFAASTACLLDDPGNFVGTSHAGATSEAAWAAAVTNDSQGDESCILGEPGGCHCACAHAVTLPATSFDTVASVLLPGIETHAPVAPSLRPTASPLRPPIA
ncbi:MAG TPA: hypothetical protein VGN46_03090 [Luteibacter sp.]|jgi:hypothetical protein|uniref:hypothetical protein n=1 Tax=Luteibacter sp. TaxID=1886636 RepID=UPI002F3F727A